MLKIFFSVDVHGSCGLWMKWLSAPEVYKADILMLCGDLTGKMLVPLIKQKDGSYSLAYWGRKFKLTTEEEVKEVEERLKNSGVYPFRSTSEEIEDLKTNPAKVERMMNEAIKRRMREWLDTVLEKVNLKKCQVFVMPGNDDIFDVDDVTKSYQDRGIAWLLDRVVEIAGFEMISLPYVNPTPWDTPREAEEPELKKKIKKLIEKLTDPSKSIFNFHCPPYNTKLDRAPELDKTLKPVTVGGQVRFIHVGSKAVREAIEKYKPIMGLHGHIHESCATDYVAGVPVINPGSEYEAGVLRGFIIKISEKGVEDFWRVEG
jgi:Icc-related predicted phosphoesterase